MTTPLKAPSGWQETLAFYGDIRRYVRADGTLRPEWERQHLELVGLPGPLPLSWAPEVTVRRIRVHRQIAKLTAATLLDIHSAGLWPELREYGGSFEYRRQRGGGRLSLHAFGAAIDLNPSTNQLGEDGDMPQSIVRIFEEHGWTWGGRWPRRDCMHFQFAKGI